MNIGLLDKPAEILDSGLRTGRKAAAGVIVKQDRRAQQKAREMKAVTVSWENVSSRLWKAVKSFPSIKELPEFYSDLFPTIIDIQKTRNAISHLSQTAKIVEKLGKETVRKMQRTGKDKQAIFKAEKRKFFGRMASVLRNAGKSIEVYNDSARKLRELPKIDWAAETVILAGYPNTGKTTILQRLTGAKAKIASYPFTTTKLNVSHFEEGHRKVQVIDTPGLLDKPEDKRNPVERKAIAALRHLPGIIVFVADPSMHCGYPLLSQKKLFEQISRNFPEKKKLLVFNKADITGVIGLETAHEMFGKKGLIEGEGKESTLKEEIAKVLK